MAKKKAPKNKPAVHTAMSGNLLSAVKSTATDKINNWKSTITPTAEYGDYNAFNDLKSFLDTKAQNNIFYQQLGITRSDQKLIEGARKYFKHTKNQEKVA